MRRRPPHRSGDEGARGHLAVAVWVLVVAGAGALALHALFAVIDDHGRATSVAKLIIALAATTFVVLERSRWRTRSESRRRGIFLGLGALAVVAHVGEFKLG